MGRCRAVPIAAVVAPGATEARAWDTGRQDRRIGVLEVALDPLLFCRERQKRTRRQVLRNSFSRLLRAPQGHTSIFHTNNCYVRVAQPDQLSPISTRALSPSHQPRPARCRIRRALGWPGIDPGRGRAINQQTQQVGHACGCLHVMLYGTSLRGRRQRHRARSCVSILAGGSRS